jgi:hypothetical protein
MSYNRFALERVGGLEIIYNRRGQVVDIFGSVKAVEGMHITKITIIVILSGRRSNDHDNRVASTVDVRIVKISVLCTGLKNPAGICISGILI